MDRIKCCDNCSACKEALLNSGGLYCEINDIEVYPSNSCKEWRE